MPSVARFPGGVLLGFVWPGAGALGYGGTRAFGSSAQVNAGGTLADLVAGGPDAWRVATQEDLARALMDSGSSGGAHLRMFCDAVQAWLHASGTDEEDRRSRYRWIKEVADQ